MSKRNMLSVLVTLILGAMLVLAVAGGRRFLLVNKLVAGVVLPLEDGLNALLHGGDEVREFWHALTELRTKNKQLMEENQALRKIYIDMTAIKKENAQLRRLLNYKESNNTRKYVAAKVVAKNFGDLRDVVYINAGYDRGMAVGNAVVTEKGLVGVVDEIYRGYARVLLITSPNCRVGARTVHTGFDSSGIVHGFHETENVIVMEHIPREARVDEGDWVVTNGYSGKHPENILIGKVVSVQMDGSNLAWEADVELAEKIIGIEQVLVIVDFEPKLNINDMAGLQR